MNGFALGLDNWIHAANGDSGGTITSKATGKKTNINGLDFRFKMTGEFEAVDLRALVAQRNVDAEGIEQNLARQNRVGGVGEARRDVTDVRDTVILVTNQTTSAATHVERALGT